MKKIYKVFGMLGLFVPLLGISQVNETENFNAGLGNWSSTQFFTTTTNACEGQSLRYNQYNAGSSLAELTSSAFTSTGGQINISFDYKVINWSGGGATPANFGTLTLEHSVNGGAYVTDTVIDASNHTPSTDCATVSTFTTGAEVADGDMVTYRFRSNYANGDYYMYLDNISLIEVVSCPAPTGFSLLSADNSSANITWDDPTGVPEWQIQYGAQGFTPGTGTFSVETTNTPTISGLTTNSFYEVYVRAICTPGTDTSGWTGPISFNTFNQGQFMAWEATCPSAGYIDISSTGTELAGLTDDGSVTAQALPFNVLFQGVLYSTFGVNNNGGMILGDGIPNVYGAAAGKPDGNLIPWGDDLDTETGAVYTHVQGTAPNRVFIVQFHERPNFSGTPTSPTISFQVQIEEATNEIYFVYDDVIFGDPQAGDDYGANADITLSGPNTDIDVSNNDATFLTSNSCVRFYYTDCPKPANLVVTDFNNDSISVSWNETGVATMWDLNYGAEGFDPDAAGTTLDVSAASDTLFDGLTQLTNYDIYVRSNCAGEDSDWFGPITQMTAPTCTNPDPLTIGYVAEDSIEYTITDNAGAAEWNVQYGLAGFELGSGTTVNTTNLTDSILNAGLMGSSVYDLYVQADCGTPGDTSQWIGPIAVGMPIVNDSTCEAITIAVDGSVNVFNNAGATIQTDENSITPPNTGSFQADGWDGSTLNNTTWFKFTAPASGIVEISTKDEDFDANIAVYETTDCSDLNTFTLVGANENGYAGFGGGAELTICGLTTGNEYYLMHSTDFGGTGNYSIKISEVAVPEAGNATDVSVCAGDILDLNTLISNNNLSGTWSEATYGTSIITNDSLFAITGLLAYNTYNFEFRVEGRCAYDSVLVDVTTVGPSSAGIDTTNLSACLHTATNLFDGLTGSVDLGGTWYDANNTEVDGNTVTGGTIAVPGAYNYTYIVSNGVCPADTSEITVIYENCIGIEDFATGEVEVYPNPTNGIVNISNNGNAAEFEIRIEDLRGRVIYNNTTNMSNGSIQTVDLTNFDAGIYVVSVKSNERTAQHKVVLK